MSMFMYEDLFSGTEKCSSEACVCFCACELWQWLHSLNHLLNCLRILCPKKLFETSFTVALTPAVRDCEKHYESEILGGKFGRGRPVETSHPSSGPCTFNLALAVKAILKVVRQH